MTLIGELMKRTLILSETEWDILRFLWGRDKASVRDVWEGIYPNKEKAYTTVQTYMSRMAGKGALHKELLGLVNYYSAAISENQALKNATDNFVKKAFNGSFGLLAQFLIESDNLDENDLQDLRKLIKRKKE